MTYEYWPPDTLVVGTWNSMCNNCGQNAIWSDGDVVHYRVGGYNPPDPDVGCGIVWRHIASSYVGMNMKEWAEKNFPNLKWVGYDE